MEDTIFMKIIRREIPAEIVYEDADTLAFLDVKPVNPGHTLVVPKKFARNLLDVDEGSLTAVMHTAQKVAIALRATGAEGVNIGINNESAAGQLVFHFHVHVIPRFAHDGFQHWHGKECSPDEFKQIAEKLREKLT
ncbi:MAG: HIT family protein [Candidatus Paceibacterota bacterium]|jgi:histidine triad (HIT) family protein